MAHVKNGQTFIGFHSKRHILVLIFPPPENHQKTADMDKEKMSETVKNTTIQIRVEETELKIAQVKQTVALLEEGSTVPFIARYRKEATGELDEVQIRLVQERLEYHTALNERRQTILKSIDDQGRLTPELRQKIEATRQKTELEDLYLPFKSKRRTKH